MRRIMIACLAVIGAALLAPARADDLTGVDRFLCSAGSVSVCCDDGQCASGAAAELDLPQFIEVDVTAKRVSTTKASGLNRTTPIDNLKRVDGLIIMQGVENKRAYSISINEKTGELAAAIAAPACSVTAFGICTPMPASK
jgi:hypothetical protein